MFKRTPHLSDVQDALLARSTPGGALYGSWLSPAEARALVAPAAPVRTRVIAALAARGADCTPLPMGLRCRSTVHATSALFRTQVHAYTQLDSHGSPLRTVHRVPPSNAFTLPTELTGHIAFVAGLYDFPTQRARRGVSVPRAATALRGAARAAQSLDGYVVPESIAARYGRASGSNLSATAPVEFGPGEAMAKVDADAFAAAMAVPPWSIVTSVGPFVTSTPGVEASLDGQYIYSTGGANAQWWWSEVRCRNDFLRRRTAGSALMAATIVAPGSRPRRPTGSSSGRRLCFPPQSTRLSSPSRTVGLSRSSA